MKEYKITINGNEYNVAINSIEDGHADVSVNGTQYNAKVDGMKAKPKVSVVQKPSVTPGNVHQPTQAAAPKAAAAAGGSGSPIKSPLPGTILNIAVREGDTVKEGQMLLVLEAMKMENNIEADKDGVIQSIAVRQGDSVLEGDLLLTIG